MYGWLSEKFIKTSRNGNLWFILAKDRQTGRNINLNGPVKIKEVLSRPPTPQESPINFHRIIIFQKFVNIRFCYLWMNGIIFN